MKSNWRDGFLRVVVKDQAENGLTEREWTFALWESGFILQTYAVKTRTSKRQPFTVAVSYFRNMPDVSNISVDKIPFDAMVRAKVRETLANTVMDVPITVDKQ